MASNTLCLRRDSFLYALIAGIILIPAILFFAQSAGAQETEVAHDTAFQSALADLSEIYGQPVTRVEQAHAICNLEKYLADCANIGKKHDLFTPEEKKQVDTVLTELKGKVVEDLKQCQDDICLVEVANRLSRSLVDKSPALAKQLELTPQKVGEKKVIVETAKEIGVRFEDCRSLDPDTASVELLRSCAKLAKHEKVQRYLPEETKQLIKINDTSLDLQDALKQGDYQCGDNTLDGCGEFCLNPAQATRANGVSAIPPICRQIAEKFFGKEGIKELEKAYNQVTSATEYYQKRAENVTFTTQDGRILTNPAEIGKYMEGEMKRGNVEAIEKGMEFMVTKGFVSPRDSEFAVRMAKKVKEQGRELNFDECARNPALCNNFIPDNHREEFKALDDVRRVMTEELNARGVPGPQLCESNPQYGEACVKGARAALPKIEEIAKQFPSARFIVEDIKKKISFAQEGVDAKRRVEEKFSRGGQELKIGDRVFSNFAEMDAFCRENGSLCLTEVARQGFIGKDYAANKYEHTFEVRFGPSGPPFGPGGFPGEGPYPGFGPPGQTGGVPPGQISGFRAPGPGFGPPPGFNKEEALKQFQQWLENPQGAPPIPSFGGSQGPYPGGTGPYPPFGPTGYPQPGPGYPPYPQQFCPNVYSRPCPQGQYRQESRDDKGCFVLSECVSVSRGENVAVGDKVACKESYRDPASCSTNPSCSWQSFGVCRNRYCPVSAAPPPLCGQGQDPYDYRGCEVCVPPSKPAICPALPTVDSCPAGQRKVVTYSSKECGTYYGCESETVPTKCPAEQYWNGTTCVSSGPQPCLAGQYWNGVTCVAVSPPPQSCPQGQYWNGYACVTGSQPCPQGQYWYVPPGGVGYCKPVESPPGPSACGTYYNKTSCTSGGCSWSRTDLFEGPYCYSSGGIIGGDASCQDLESLIPGCHSMPESPNVRFDSSMTKYVVTGTRIVKYCSTEPIPGCSGVGGGATGSCTQELISLLGSGCHSMANAYFDGGMTKYVFPGTNVIKDCTTNYISSCTVGGGTSAACSDGRDNDGDGKIDYPADTGCYNSSDTDESFPCPSGYRPVETSTNSSSYCQSTTNSTQCQPIGGGATYICPGGTTTSSSCDSPLIALLGDGCHQMYTDSSGNYIFCDGPMSKSAKRGDTVTTTGCSSPGTTPGAQPACSDGRDNDGDGKIDYPADDGCYSSTDYDETIPTGTGGNTCPSFAHDMSGYCMLNNDTTRCAEYPGSSEGSYTNTVCQAHGTGGGTAGGCGSQTSQSTCSTQSGCSWYTPSSGTGWCQSASATTCPSGQYWYTPPGGGAGYCTSSTTTTYTDCSTKYGSGWHTMDSSGNCFNSSMTEYRTTSGALYQCSTTPTSGCSGTTTTTTTCPSGQYWNGSACVTSTTTTCPSGQYWNGTACVTSTTSSGCSTPSSCYDSAICGSSGWYWYNSGCWSSPQTTTGACPSGQYWNGTSCVSSTTTTCPSGQYWNGTACVSSTTTPPPPPPPPSAFCGDAVCNGSETSASCPGDCPPPPPPPPPPSAFLYPRTCPLSHDWNGYYCTVRPQYTAHFFAQVRTSLGQMAGVVQSLLNGR